MMLQALLGSASTLTSIYIGDQASDTFIAAGDDYSYLNAAITDTNGHSWNGGDGIIQYMHQGVDDGKTRVRIDANVSQTYWSSIVWTGRGSIFQGNVETFTAWNGTYTEWKFAGDGLALAANAGSAAVTLTIT